MRIDDFNYDLPVELIAQDPAPERQLSRLMVLDRRSETITHSHFDHILKFLRSGDLLVVNRTRVMPARLHAARPSGGSTEILLLRPLGENQWSVLARPSRKLSPGMTLQIQGASVTAEVGEALGDGQWTVRFVGTDVADQLHAAGQIPLPPYIRDSSAPPERYQTVYADREGSVAAPTAGLHFTPEIIERLSAAGIEMERITLHVGAGTFKPVTVERVDEHHMHAEWGEIPSDVAARITEARQQGRRIVAVGTTSTRLLESATKGGITAPFVGDTDRFIYPGYRFGAIDGLITNFHLPKSTLLMLVSALAGTDFIQRAYAEAIRERYRFFSFGDAMLIV